MALMLREDERQTELLQKEITDFTPDYLPIYPASLSGLIHFPVCPVLSFCVCFVRLFFPGMGYRTLQASLSDGILSFTQGVTFNLTVLTSSSRHTRNNDGESHGVHGH